MTSITAPGTGRGRRSGRPGPGPAGRQGRAAAAFLAPSAIGFATFTLLPIIGSVVLAFFTWPVLGQRGYAGLTNFRTLLTSDPVFFTALRNTLLFVVLYVPINFVLALGLALWISPRIRGRAAYRVLFFLPTVTPLVANALVWKLLLQPGGVVPAYLHSWFGISAPNFLGSPTWAMLAVVAMSVWSGTGYNMLVFSAALDGIPDHLYEAAALDGAGPVRRFWHVTVPMLSPAMFFASVLTIITSFQVFAQPYILTGGGPGVSTTTMVLYLYQRGFQFFQLGMASAVATCLFAMIVLVTALQFLGQRKWVHYDA